MKVLKSGQKWTHEVTCKSCKAKLLIEEGDVRYRIARDVEMSRGDFYITCFDCKTENSLGEFGPAAMPQHLKAKLQKEYRGYRHIDL